jgi:hypothetical protein
MGLSLMYFENGAARFAGTFRGVDEAGHYAFELQLSSLPPLYGEWKTKWEQNKIDFNAEIVSFGYLRPENIPNPNAGARRRLSTDQRDVAERLIVALFCSAEARNGTFPFTTKKGNFRGGVGFSSGWVLLE